MDTRLHSTRSEMGSNNTMTKDELLEHAETVLTRLRARLDNLPDAEDAPTERQSISIRAEGMNGRSLAGRIRNTINNVKTPKASLDLRPLIAWRNILTNAKDHFESELQAFEALSLPEQRRCYNDLSALRFALRIVMDGPNSEEGESPLLNEWLKHAGVRPEWGQRTPFEGRGGLRSVKRRISDVEKRLTDTAYKLEHFVTEAEALLAKPEITGVERQSATA